MGWPDGRPALDYTVNAAIGVPAMTGPPEHDGPVNHVFPAWDFLTGALAAFSLLAAERNRRETGQGREIRLPLSDVALGSLGALGQIARSRRRWGRIARATATPSTAPSAGTSPRRTASG